MSIQAMITSLRNNNRRKKRMSLFEKNDSQSKSKFGEFADHKKMKTYEFAAFQKEIFQRKKEEKIKRRLLYVGVVLATILIVIFLSLIAKYYDFDLLTGHSELVN